MRNLIWLYMALIFLILAFASCGNKKQGPSEIQIVFRPTGVRSGPVLAGTVLCASGADGSIYGVSSKTGVLLWKTFLCNNEKYAPTILWANERVVVVGRRKSNPVALDPATGKQIEIEGIHSDMEKAPIAEGSFEYQVVGTRIRKVDKADNKEVWSKTLTEKPSGQLALKDGSLLFGMPDGRVLCIDATNGSTRWTFQAQPSKRKDRKETMQELLYEEWTSSGIYTTPVICGNVVTFATLDGVALTCPPKIVPG